MINIQVVLILHSVTQNVFCNMYVEQSKFFKGKELLILWNCMQYYLQTQETEDSCF